MAEYICKCCGKEYTSKKKGSKYCSKECRKKAGSVTHNCDYCGKPYKVISSKYQLYLSGEIHHLCCSKECASAIQHTQVRLVCEHCGKPFMMFNCFKDIQKFCSRKCYYEHISENAKCKTIECPICNKPFKQTYKNQIYCSKECRGISDRKREIVTCAACGKQFERVLNQIKPDGHNYCSKTCMRAGLYWSKEDISILRENYNHVSKEQIVSLLGNKYTMKQIKSRVAYYDISPRDYWSEDEIQILIDNYTNVPFAEVQRLLPKRTYSSILGKARSLGLFSFWYRTNTYSKNELNYLKENWNTKTISEMAAELKRSESGVEQKLYQLGLKTPITIKKSGYGDLVKFMRSRLTIWRDNVKKENNYTCCITGKRSNIIVHHCRSFTLLFDEVVEILNFPLYNDFNNYTDTQLEKFVDTFMVVQESYGAYVCITESVHKAFHGKYGYGYNTEEQWEEFKQSYKYE